MHMVNYIGSALIRFMAISASWKLSASRFTPCCSGLTSPG